MCELPGYFEHIKEIDQKSGVHGLVYDESIKAFLIENKQIDLMSFDPYAYNSFELFGLDDEGIDVDEIPNRGLLIPAVGGLIGTPKLHQFAQSNPRVVDDTLEVMIAAYSEFYEDAETLPRDKNALHLGFSSGLGEGGGLILQVLGNCACMGPDPHSYITEDQFEHDYAQYVLHNADSQTQRASLYAGFGHLAFLAEGRESAQATLF